MSWRSETCTGCEAGARLGGALHRDISFGQDERLGAGVEKGGRSVLDLLREVNVLGRV